MTTHIKHMPSKGKTLLALLAASALSAFAAPAHKQPRYTAIELGYEIPFWPDPYSSKTNKHGEYVFTVPEPDWQPWWPITRAYRVDRHGVTNELLAEWNWTSPLAINDHGVVVGWDFWKNVVWLTPDLPVYLGVSGGPLCVNKHNQVAGNDTTGVGGEHDYAGVFLWEDGVKHLMSQCIDNPPDWIYGLGTFVYQLYDDGTMLVTHDEYAPGQQFSAALLVPVKGKNK